MNYREFGKAAQDDAQRVGEALMNVADEIDRLRAALGMVIERADDRLFPNTRLSDIKRIAKNGLV